ncbi:MAG: Crp/Fnr family transcriptional regulator [Sphingobacterium sp.]|jgi:CRP-like cAMP-binding protein|uniref:Crp/Fnr family transcriptional regulator n=1 Tax=unclassified Sphingobacterium TaxID=2609468 RepID=UPI00098590C5|nr:Crp/Fnr family transcriptional regulator [Sphingobacterium sp. CZ-UAM]MDF2515155.1 Crp/Fnr family transcriptional regulator [Sphingobacterium sp.]OOG19418.1 hypothetical protein BWD42_05670 [Sphingobacterium sp. CZ-UAM]
METSLIQQFKEKINYYHPISEESFQELVALATVVHLKKNEILVHQDTIAREFCFLYNGYLRAYISDEKGRIYTKNIAVQGDFIASTVSCLLGQPSKFTIQAITDCSLLHLSYKKFRELIFKTDDLKSFYIYYLEKNWVIAKEEREISIVMEDAQVRYEKLLKSTRHIEKYVPLQDIASHLGITPTQLSRIRRQLK